MHIRTLLAATLFGSTLCIAMAGASPVHEHSSEGGNSVHAGQQVFTRTCSQCHAVVEGQYSFGPNLYHVTRKTPRKSSTQLRTIIDKGKGKMPSFGEKLSSTEKTELIAYLKSL